MIIGIVAHSNNFCIGKNNTIPWKISEDMKRFKVITTGGIVVFGKNTWESLPVKPLPDRTNVIISKSTDRETLPGGVQVFDSVDAFMKIHKDTKQDIFICGGTGIYEGFLPYTEKFYVTVVNQTVHGDAYLKETIFDDFRVTRILSNDGFKFEELMRTKPWIYMTLD